MLLTSSLLDKQASGKAHSKAFVVLDSGIDYLPFLAASLRHADVLVLDNS